MPRDGRVNPSTTPIDADAFTPAAARHLLRRAGFGGTPEQVRVLTEWGPKKSVDHLLDDAGAAEAFEPPRTRADIQPAYTEAQRRQFARARRAGDEQTLARLRSQRQQQLRADRQQIRALESWWLRRMIETPYPLIEKMTLFWHGHFASSHRKVRNSAHMLAQNMFFRENALGSFEDLLQGIIKDPAMLRYLDNNANTLRSPNENLSREIMELFALGSGYSEKDIKEGARALTGYTYEGDAFVFRSPRHDKGTKTIFGKRGNFDGEDFVRLILARSECPRFVCEKLYTFFVNDIPDNSHPRGRAARNVIERLAKTMIREKYVIKPVLRELFLSEHFYDSQNRARLIKSPIELLVGTVRALGTPLRNERGLLESADRMGHRLFHPPSVQGWVGGRTWINTATIFERQNAATYLITGDNPIGRRDGTPYDPSPLLSGLRVLSEGALTDPVRVSDELCDIALANAATERHRAALRDYFSARDNRVDNDTLAGALALLAATPEYQLA